MRWLRPMAVAVGFLTRLPVYRDEKVEEADIGRSLAWFPLAGLVLGLLLLGLARLVGNRLPAPLVAVALAGALAWLTGGLHLDGLADVADGFGGGHGDRTRTLEIMRDSRIGAHGAAALTLLLLGKVAALGEVVQRGEDWALLAFPVVARFAVVPLVLAFPYARPEGLGGAFKRHGRARHLIVAAVLAAGLLAPLDRAALPCAGAALLAALAFALWARARLGGLTGDVYGACIELAELAFLAAATLRWRS